MPVGGVPRAFAMGSFLQPVMPPVSDPRDGPLFYIPINCDWMPFVAGALFQLLLETTWDVDDPDTLSLILQRAATLQSLFSCATAPTIDELCGIIGSESGDCGMGCCLRFQNGRLQQLNCGVWEDIPGQPTGGFQSEPQPGTGQPQPAPNGGCQVYHGSFDASSRWILPTLVNTGDTLTLNDFSGATNGDLTGEWRCPDGAQFFGDICIDNQYTDPGNVAPALFTGQLMWNIGGTYYDALLPLTVPGGVTNGQAFLEVNYNPSDRSSGNVTFDVEVCNNQGSTWSSVLDFETNPYSSHVTITVGSYVPGSGYQGQPSGSSLSYLQFDIALGACTLTSSQITYDCGVVSTGSAVEQFTDGSTYGTPQVPATTGTSELYSTTGSRGVTNLLTPLLDAGNSTPSSTLIRKVALTGTGVKPSWLP